MTGPIVLIFGLCVVLLIVLINGRRLHKLNLDPSIWIRCLNCRRWFNLSGDISYFEPDNYDRANQGVCEECQGKNRRWN